MTNNNIPLFFKDESNNPDHEIMLDYFLSWTLRCAQESNDAIKLREASKLIVAYLVKLAHPDFKVLSVLTWKQWKKIDLTAEIIIELNGTEEKYAILFENKMYTHIHSDQLARYKECFDAHYNQKPEYKKLYIVLSCFHKECDYQIEIDECKKHNFEFYSFGWLKYQSGLKEKTGYDLFDEFWFRYW